MQNKTLAQIFSIAPYCANGAERNKKTFLLRLFPLRHPVPLAQGKLFLFSDTGNAPLLPPAPVSKTQKDISLSK